MMGWCGMHHAALNGHLEVVRALLGAGATANCRTFGQEETPLVLASTYGHLEIVELLLEKGAWEVRGLGTGEVVLAGGA